jgi:hypothetical protein
MYIGLSGLDQGQKPTVHTQGLAESCLGSYSLKTGINLNIYKNESTRVISASLPKFACTTRRLDFF